MEDEQLHKYFAYLEGRSQKRVGLVLAHLEVSGVDIPELLTKRYGISRRWADRALCVSECIRYAKTNDDAYRLGIAALEDRSRSVRRIACSLLAKAQRPEAIEHLEKLLPDEVLGDDAKAAIAKLKKR